MIKKWLTVIGKTILLLIGITFLSFLLVYHSPGDPAMVALKKSGMRVSEEALELKREELGLNDPFAVQYGRWLNEFFHGDLGESYKTGKVVAGELKKTIPATLLLTVAALALTILISFPIGVLCAKYKDRGFDNMIRFVTYFLSSLPSFFLALLLMYVLSMKLQLLPVIGSVSGKGIIMPALVLALTLSAWYIRQIRGIVRPSPALSRTHLHTRGWCKGKQPPCRSLHPGRSFSSHGQSQQTVPALSEAAPEPLPSLFYLLYPDVLSSVHVISPFEFLRLFLMYSRNLSVLDFVR